MSDLNRQTLRQRNMVRLKEAVETAKDSLNSSKKEVDTDVALNVMKALWEQFLKDAEDRLDKRKKSNKNHS